MPIVIFPEKFSLPSTIGPSSFSLTTILPSLNFTIMLSPSIVPDIPDAVNFCLIFSVVSLTIYVFQCMKLD